MSLIPIDEVVHFDVITSTPATSAAVDADSAPTYDVFEEGTDTPILDDQTMTKRTSLTGNYRGSFTASAANGFEAGKWYNVVATGIVGGVTGKCVAMRFRVAPAETSAGVPQVRASAIADGAITDTTLASNTITAAKIAADAITDAKVASDVTIASVTGAVGSVTGAVGSVTGNVGGNVAGSVASVTAGVTLADGAITAAKIATDAIDADALAADAVTELQSGLSTLNAAGVRTAVGLASANLDTQLDALPTAAENATAVTTSIGTGTALTALPWNAAWDAEVESEVADALEATVADSIPADGTRPSVKQALYMLTQFMVERAVSSTTVTVKKPDGSTTLFTLTLNDATTPTSITRAT